MVLEHNRCIKCRRCVEEVKSPDGKRVFTYLNRGNDTRVGIDYTQEALLSDEQAHDAMNLCPTGAILVRGMTPLKPFGDRPFDLLSSQVDFKRMMKERSEPMEKKIIATVSLSGCFGCHMSLLDIDTGILDLVDLVSFNKSPLTDIKSFSTRCHLGIVEGSCGNDENVELLREFRKMCDILIVVGECAVWGGLPAMRNTIPLGECLEEAYLNSVTNEVGGSGVPYHEDLPKLLDRIYACSELVKVDYVVPGCPPSADHLWKVIKNLLWGEGYSILYSEFKYD
jgi:[NiFe] hydrogenase diaphorase moiety small subunit